MSLQLIVLFCFLSIFSSFIGAFASGGSTIILLGFLLLLSPDPYLAHLAIAKIAASVLMITSGLIHLKQQKINWRFSATLMFTGLLGMVIGTYLVQFVLSERLIHVVVGGIFLALAGFLLFGPERGIHPRTQYAFSVRENLQGGSFSFFISILNAISGGMGNMVNTYLVFFHKVSFIQASAYLMLSGVLVTSLQAVYLSTQVPLNWPLMISVTLGSLTGAYIGTKFQYLKGNVWVKNAAALLMIVFAIQLFI